MWFVVFVGLGLLGLGASYAVAWVLLLFAADWIAAGIATFCALTAAGGVAGRVRPASPPTAGLLGAWTGAFLAMPLVGVSTAEDSSTLLWFMLGAVLGLIGGGMLSAFTAKDE